MRKKLKAMLAIMVITVLIMGTSVYARTVDYFGLFYVTYSGNEVDTNWVLKSASPRKAVINLSSDTGSSWVTVRMKNASNTTVGTCVIQQGTRVIFTNGGNAGTYYALGLKAMYSGSVYIV